MGILNAALSEKLQLDANLTLEKTVTKVRHSEAIKQHQSILRDFPQSQVAEQVAAVSHQHKSQERTEKGKEQDGQIGRGHKSIDSKSCSWCGNSHAHSREQCPAKHATCYGCGKQGQLRNVCRSSKGHNTIKGIFLGTLTNKQQSRSDPWRQTLLLNDKPIYFKLDTGADVTVISTTLLEKIHKCFGPLQPATKILHGPNSERLPVQGLFMGKIRHGDTEVTEEVPRAYLPLLGWPAIESLGLLQRVNTVMNTNTEQIVKQYPNLFDGLGKLEGNYTICMEEGAKPFAVTTPRRVAIPLLPQVKTELERMEQLKVISRIEEPTDWCAPMVVVPKANGTVRICVDLTKLNESVRRERHPLPAIEQILAQLTGAQQFSKLDANSGFWQIPLSPESARLTTFITPFGRFHFNRLPFGITSAPEHFQRRMSTILNGLDGVVCLMDDVLIHGKTQAEHDQRLHSVLHRLQITGLTLNKEKCEFKTQIKFLGQLINSQGIQPDPDKVKAILHVPEPINTGDIRRFLGMVNQ